MTKINPRLLKALENDQENSVEMLPGMSVSGGMAHDNPAVREVVAILENNPLYVQPTLNFLRQKHSEVAAATLSALYTPEQLAAMREQHGIKPSSK